MKELDIKRLVFIAIGLIIAGCGGDGSGEDQCGPGLEMREGACQPVFDECGGPTQVPVLGGGCLAAGVTTCAGAFESDGAGGCDPILPDETCASGTMAVVGEPTCQPVGVPQCAAGFESDGEGGLHLGRGESLHAAREGPVVAVDRLSRS